MNVQPLRIGTRRSQLALWQTNFICQQLQTAWQGMTCEIVPFVTQGDRILDKPLAQIGGKGLFTAELEGALCSAEIDLAVHSLKDLPTADPHGLTIGCVPQRADVRDVLIAPSGKKLDALPRGAIVGTSSLRRKAQLLAVRDDLEIRPIRGNVDTRIRKVNSGDYDAIVLAAAGVTRLGLEAHITEWLPTDVMLPAAGQGALGVQCRANDTRILELLAAIEERGARECVVAERTFLAGLGGGCSTPIGAYATSCDGKITLQGVVTALDGSRRVAVQGEDADPVRLGQRLAQAALAQGAQELIGG